MEDVNTLYTDLIVGGYFTDEELNLVTDINGWSIETLNDCIYARYACHDYEQLVKEGC